MRPPIAAPAPPSADAGQRFAGQQIEEPGVPHRRFQINIAPPSPWASKTTGLSGFFSISAAHLFLSY